MSSSLESLPNEVLWLSWEYLPAIDLFRSFHNLNQRFNTILHSMHYRLDLLHLNKSEMNYFLGTILPHVERQRIESIFLDDIAERLFWIHSCQHLRSLTIRNLRPMSIEPVTRHILVELKMLNYLCLQSEFTLRDEDLNVLTSTIFSDRMPSLTYCHLAFENFEKIRFDHLSTNNRSLSLKSLVFDQWCRLRDFIRLLHFVPNIKRLTVRLFDSDSKG